VLTGLAAATIPSPSSGVWEIGPVPLRGYALCIILGMIAAIWIGERRWVARGGKAGDIQDIALIAIPLGLVGARAYHVATDWQNYFGADASPITALYLWRGGLGIWGGIAFGVLGVWIGARWKGYRFSSLVDAIAPGVLVAQAIGRVGNWFNQELYGGPTDLPWGLEIDRAHFTASYVEQLLVEGQPIPETATFHPTFLYEGLWNLAAFALIVFWLERRYRLGHGRVMAVYVMAYTAGRTWVESLRIDDVQLDDVFGLRWNVWLSIALFVLAAAWFVRSLRRHPGVPEDVRLPGARAEAAETEAAESEVAGESPETEAVEASGTDVTDEPDETDVTDDTSGESRG
jgi:prolipoprotein diacylglyceryl transferase